MAALVLTVIGDDRTGLVNALSDVIARHHGNWERSEMAELAGKFAGIVLVTVPDDARAALVHELGSLRDQGLLDVTAAVSDTAADTSANTRLSMSLVGNDRPGIVRDLSAVLASHGVSIEELRTSTREAPMTGGTLFEADATLVVRPDHDPNALRQAVEQLAGELMVDIDITGH
jgi:glycine cleavage system regulatory protein